MNKRIRELREKSGMSATQVSALLGVHLITYYGYENGKKISESRKLHLEQIFGEKIINTEV